MVPDKKTQQTCPKYGRWNPPTVASTVVFQVGVLEHGYC